MFVLKCLTLLPIRNKSYHHHFRYSSTRVIKMESDKSLDYEAAVKMLNSLQSNAQYIQNVQKNKNTVNRNLNIDRKYLQRVGINQDRLETLSVIHVTGTKGKGTTCAFTESILRHHGFKTGFYSSPHLVEVRERIRINGKLIGKSEFAKYFWRIFSILDREKDDDSDMPLYFRFLTIMAFSIFLDAKVDVAILEVGIGGEYDCTNVINKVPVVGINSIGIDHTILLGDTIESIAWNKGGIMKEGCQAFTVPQADKAMKVLQSRAIEKKCTLNVINNSSEYSIFSSDIVNLNANLAVNLCKAWLSTRNEELRSETTKTALSNCTWPGRYDIKVVKNLRYYLDGAHTEDSVRHCAQWFKKHTIIKSKRKRVLLFNVTGGRNVQHFIQELFICNFDYVFFVANRANKFKQNLDNFVANVDQQLVKLEEYRELWLKMDKSATVKVFASVEDAVEYLDTTESYDVLVTGSLHLIGAVLTLIQPHLNNSS